MRVRFLTFFIVWWSTCTSGFLLYDNRIFQSRSFPSARSSASSSCENNMDVAVDRTQLMTLEVCLSPGCLADGAQGTLQKLQALISDETNTTKVVKGVCCSLCGNGPVVILNGNQKIRQVNSNDKILKLLILDNQDDVDESDYSRFQSILQSFDLIEQARASVKSREFVKGTKLFQQGIDLGMHQLTTRDKFSLTQVSYLIEALKEQTFAFLQIPAKKDAVDAARCSIDLIRNSSDQIEDNDEALLILYSSLECLQEALEACNKGIATVDKEILAQEFKVLQDLMSLPELAGLSSTQQNKRRSHGFRLQKLERELKRKHS
jgi:hypothetical protein